MSVRIHLDNPHAFYTNLDFISGKVVLSLVNDETVSAIVVKLEGESKTILIRPPPNFEDRRQRDEKNRIANENHKILYRIQQVFPDLERGTSGMLGSYTLRAGQHEYPFKFKIPFNNSCGNQNLQNMGLSFGGIRLMDLPQQLQYRHVQKALPPSLSGFPGEAEIRYYIKVTVQRPGIFKENRRSQVGFKFTPIEPIRPPLSGAESFARRPHAFKAGLSGYGKKSSLWKKAPKPLSDTPPSVLVDARLPSPAILTCNEPIPLRILVKKQTESPEMVFLLSVQIDLIGHTYVRAQDLTRTESNTWVVMSLAGLSKPIGNPNDPVGTEALVDSSMWDHVKLPSTVTPSFDTCNLTRSYEVEVRVVLGFGHPGEVQPQTQLLPLRFPVQVYSGIAPSQELIDAMASGTTASLSNPSPQPAPSSSSPSSQPNRPTFDPAYPPQLSTAGANPADAPPPSYEDAMADEIGPVDGPRRDYSGVTNENGPSEVGDGDVKSGNSGRLFPGSGPGPSPTEGRSGRGGYVV